MPTPKRSQPVPLVVNCESCGNDMMKSKRVLHEIDEVMRRNYSVATKQTDELTQFIIGYNKIDCDCKQPKPKQRTKSAFA